MSRVTKSIAAMLAAVALVFAAAGFAFADATSANVDLGKKGSITATLEASDGTHPAGGALSLYHVANLVLVDGNMTYIYTTAFEGCEVSLEDVTIASLATEIDAYVKEHDIAAETASDISSAGGVSFSDLSVGLYLIAQTTASEGYSSIDPFLVSIPLDVDDEWVYDVDASPKVEPVSPESPDNPNPDNPNPDNPNPDNPNSGGNTPSGTTGGSGGTTGTGTGTSGTTGTGTGTSGTTGSTLPQTGQLNWPIPVLAVAGALCIVVGVIVILFSRKKGSHTA